ncbi:flagellar assembly protein FliH [Helicobacter burdigaliensis]|uniref:flagellar assembly protein FliH n=1 Tax=Helicobacter burdigaliensis TaxID=2315334 RepID=UPI000EF6C174|nr:flagellar assembly protein FliH [Helicobacter burdigaliensis]
MNNINEHENVITGEHKNRHDIKKYNFRNMEVSKNTQNAPQSSTSSNTQSIIEEAPIAKEQPLEATPLPVETPAAPQPMIDAPALKLFEAEVVDKILQKSDVLAQSLQKLQEQFDKQEQEIASKVANAENKAKEAGFSEGYSKAKEELEASINAQKELYALSITRLNQNIEDSKNHILKLEKELSSIALDIAKEVILSEVSSNSSKIASSLARALLSNVAQNSNITLKVFPGDFESLKETLQDLTHIKIEADKAIAKGGVVIMSNEGNIDGDLHLRFETLKKSILENKD